MVVAFTYFYTTVIFEQQNYGDNLKRSGAQIPGVHSGAATQKYLSRIQSRITLPGALLLGRRCDHALPPCSCFCPRRTAIGGICSWFPPPVCSSLWVLFAIPS